MVLVLKMTETIVSFISSSTERLLGVNVPISDYMSFCFQFQKQGRDVEKVKQRLAEIANYVDKVKHPFPVAQEE